MNNKDYIYFFMVVICIGIIISLFVFIKSETAKCVKNPYVYGASKMGDVDCSCIQKKYFTGCPALFSFNDTSFVINKNVCGGEESSLYTDIDWGELNITK